jgi:hypothetical protein
MTDKWVELRVHGVSGAPPESLLDRPHVRQIDGDDKSRFFRAVDANDHVLDADDGHAVEGFHWGRYTSGSWRQAFWVGLLPFGLINTAAFMLPSPHSAGEASDRPAKFFRMLALAMLRFLALLLTLVFSFAISLTLIYIVGARWATRSSVVPHWLQPAVPSVAVVVCALVIVVLGGASLLARAMGRRAGTAGLNQALRATPSAAPAPTEKSAGDGGKNTTPFAAADFYTGDTDTPTLRGLHVAAGLAVPAIAGLSFADKGFVRAGVLLGIVLVVTVLLGDPERSATTAQDGEPDTWVGVWHKMAKAISGLAVLAGFVLVGLAAHAVYDTARTDAEAHDALDRYVRAGFANRYDNFDALARYLLYGGFAGLFLLAVAVIGLSFATRKARASSGFESYFRPYSKGMTALPVAALAVFLGVGFSAALPSGTATILNERGGKPKAQLGITEMLDRVAYAWGLAMVPILLIALFLLVQRVRSAKAIAEHALIGYPKDSDFPKDRLNSWRKALAGAVWAARVKNGTEAILWTWVSAATLLSAALVLELMWTKKDKPWWALDFLSRQPSDGHWALLITQLGTWVLLGLILGLVTLARGAFRDASTRRGVNIVWDVIAFWPHAVHPFIPTPYSQKAVGDLTERIRHHAAANEPEGRSVVVCGHSQGSLVSFAALSLLSDEECAHVGLLTFGSQLRVIFSRAFPLYINSDAVTYMYGRLGGAWVNLYRDTDPLAGPVLSWNHQGEGDDARSGHFPQPWEGDRADPTVGRYLTRRSGDDWRLVDPPPRVAPLQTAPVNLLYGHSNYWTNPEWKTAVDEVQGR